MQLKWKKRIDYYAGGLFLFLLQLPIALLDRLSRRSHDPAPRGDIVVLKFMGGGSLVLAGRGLLSLKTSYPASRLILVTFASAVPYARLLGVFDEIHAVDGKTLLASFVRSLRTIVRCAFADTVVNLEVHSKLATVFATLLVGSRNRFSFYRENLFWRRGVSTHLIYFNYYYNVTHFYGECAVLLGAHLVSLEDWRQHFSRANGLSHEQQAESTEHTVTIHHACSELGKERMLTPAQWAKVLAARRPSPQGGTIQIVGAPTDRSLGDAIIRAMRSVNPSLQFRNLCGATTLQESLVTIARSHEFWGIDSGILHIARLLGVASTSFWGPTDPKTRLEPFPWLKESVFYKQISCSPCVHAQEEPPCGGNNLCIKQYFT